MQTASAIVHAKQILDTIFYKNAEKFIAQYSELNNIVNLLEDKSSKLQFLDEIAYLSLSEINKNIAALYASPMKPENWKRIAAQWESFSKSKDCPYMEAPPNEKIFLHNMLITTFLAQQYSYEKRIIVEKGEVFLDCGACFGDTALWAYSSGAERVYSFEPSPFNYPFLVRNIKNNGYDAALCHQLAVGDSSKEIPFAAAPGMAGSSRVNDAGNIMVPCIALDDWCDENGIVPTFIKMDIEGQEVPALHGCKRIIEKHKPKLAVCLYHKPSDMWNVPSLVHKICPQYKFFCRKNNVANEFILYATVN